MASDVDAWVELAAENKVQNLSLSLIVKERGRGRGRRYSVHHSMYSNSWLKQLRLKECIIAGPPPTGVQWRSMTEISLYYCFMPQHVIDHIISGCPALSRLTLKECSGFDRLEIGGQRFRSLAVEYQGLLEVSAPYMTDLEYGGDSATRTMRLTNAVSLQKVDLQLAVFDNDKDPFQKITTNAYQIFHTICCVKILHLKGYTLLVVAMMAANGCQLPQLKAHDITLSFVGRVLETHAAILILESSPLLETFTIHGSQNGPGSIELRHNLNCDLLHLKTLKIFVNVDVLCSCKSSFILARTILDRAPILEEMDICKDNVFPPLKGFIGIFETLSSYPRLSHRARIVIS